MLLQSVSSKLQDALTNHPDYNLPKHSESLQVDIVKLVNAIFELVNTSDGNNTASTLLGSIFNEPMTEAENIGTFVRNKQLTYTTIKN